MNPQIWAEGWMADLVGERNFTERTFLFPKVTDPGMKIHFKSQRLIPPSLKKENLSHLALRYVTELEGKLAVETPLPLSPLLSSAFPSPLFFSPFREVLTVNSWSGRSSKLP